MIHHREKVLVRGARGLRVGFARDVGVARGIQRKTRGNLGYAPSKVGPIGQRGRSKREGKVYSVQDVDPPSAARKKLADFFNILLKLLQNLRFLHRDP